jgi:hypothetical protein
MLHSFWWCPSQQRKGGEGGGGGGGGGCWWWWWWQRFQSWMKVECQYMGVKGWWRDTAQKWERLKGYFVWWENVSPFFMKTHSLKTSQILVIPCWLGPALSGGSQLLRRTSGSWGFFFFLFSKIRMVSVLALGPEKMGALSPVLIQFLKKIN